MIQIREAGRNNELIDLDSAIPVATMTSFIQPVRVKIATVKKMQNRTKKNDNEKFY